MNIWTGNQALRRLAPLILVGTILAGMSAGGALANGEKVWTVVKSSGAAEVQPPAGNWTVLKPGDLVAPGHRIRTGENGSVELDQNGDSMTVTPNSRAQIAAKKVRSESADVTQSSGTLLFKIVKRAEGDPKFKVSTPYLAAIIKGTTFSVTVNETGAALHVATGLVQVESRLTRQVELVRPGQTAAVSSKRGTSMKLTGGKSKANKGAAIGGGSGKPEASNGNGGKAGIKNAIGGGRINVFKATKGLVENHGPAVGKGRRSPKSGSAQVASKGNSGNPKLPGSIKKVLRSVAKSTGAARANAGNGGGGSGNGNNGNNGNGHGKKP